MAGHRWEPAMLRRSMNESDFRASAASQESMIAPDSTTSGGTTDNLNARTLRKCCSNVETYRRQTSMKMTDSLPKKKYMKRFVKIFSPIIGEDTLHDCYSCSLYQDSIASGHLYVTSNWFCFYSNLLGRQRQVAIDVNKIQTITQERTAKIIPNAIKITTENETYVFSAFISRDRAYRTMVRLWHRCDEPTTLSGESDLSDVDSMTRIVAIEDYAGHAFTRAKTESEDSSSEVSTTLDVEVPADNTSTSSVIEFVAPPPADESQETDSKEKETPSSLETQTINNLECKQWPLWSKACGGMNCVLGLVQWCYRQSSATFGEANRFYNILIICTGLLALMTFYLGVRIFFFEQDQFSYIVRRQLQLHDTNLRYQVEMTLELNHKLLTQMTNLLINVHELVDETRNACRHMASPLK